jgi:hypothetical protein
VLVLYTIMTHDQGQLTELKVRVMKLDLARDLVHARCWGRCEGCGTFGDVQVHHRLARGSGGVHRAAAEAANDVRNLLALCWRCHADTEDADTWRECEAKGWRLRHGIDADPFETPALIHTVQGHGWWYLTENGGYRWADLPIEHRFTWREKPSDGTL